MNRYEKRAERKRENERRARGRENEMKNGRSKHKSHLYNDWTNIQTRISERSDKCAKETCKREKNEMKMVRLGSM